MQLVVSNISYEEYLHYYTEYREKYNREDIRASARNSAYTFWAANVYDTVWASCPRQSHKNFEFGSDYGNMQQSEMMSSSMGLGFRECLEGFWLYQLSGGHYSSKECNAIQK